MSNFRFTSLNTAINRKPKEVTAPSGKISDYFGELTFNRVAMQEFLPKEIYKNLVNAIEKGDKVDRKIADLVAAALKNWAMGKGVTHYTHWFQPLTGSTAEKHDAFLSAIEDGRGIENFQGGNLIQQEPDASSFPSGGIRNTFEARGYTAWDPSSPAFIIDKTLCIPTIFIAYTGEALDYKTPLIKSLQALDKSASAVCQYFDKNITKVVATLGIEQEYFLVDEALFNARPDLFLTGRTLFGHASAKDQQLADQYFGSIPERVVSFMKDFEYEAHKLGIPIKTRHNEVAPNQFECAPIHEEANLAVDHNLLLMDIIDKTAAQHNFRALFHEKPYAGVNGSGKHNNWSLLTNTGINLLSPGRTPKSNFRFLAFLVCIIKALNNHTDLLRGSIASASNDYRLGSNEAPPAIISAFIGEQLTRILDEIEKDVKKENISADQAKELSIGIPKIPEILLDNTDRNRTSSFAFTGNKFEFRAVGSSANCSAAMIVLNTIVADQLAKFKKEVDELLVKNTNKDDAIYSIIKKYIKESKRIRFEGNSYSEEWLKEAEKRELSNIKSTPEAIKAYVLQSTIKLFENNSVLNERELKARYEIKLENYIKKVQIEARVIGDLAINHIIPIAIKYQNVLIESVRGLKELFDETTYKRCSHDQLKTILEITEHINEIKSNVDKMIEERKTANNMPNNEQKAKAYNEKVLPFFDIMRAHTDRLEFLIDDEIWPLPKYRELLFTR
ncbi:MAG: glutamine synthetase III [Bacteroidales bacterium]|nr:glutamine synthetase III [Bacteroidales bacterium]